MAALDNDAPIISYSSLSKAYLAPGWRAGWMAVGSSPRLDPALAAIKKLADGRLCSPGPMQYAVTAALTGDRSHQIAFRKAAARARRADDHAHERDSRHVVRDAEERVLRDAQGRTAAGQDRHRLRARPVALEGRAHASTDRDSAPRSKTASSASSSSPRCKSSARSTTMSQTSPQSSDPRSADPLRCVAVGDHASSCCGRCTWSAGPLLLIYVCALFATGLAPLVRDHRAPAHRCAIGKRRAAARRGDPRHLRTVIGRIAGIGAAVIPPLVRQSQEFWKELPELLDRRSSSWRRGA